MEIIKELNIRRFGNRGYRYALFKCPVCGKKVEKIKTDGLKLKQCSRACYNKKRTGVKRGNYKHKIISKKYIYVYKPNHPHAIGTRKLYIAEHRLVMEKHIGRYLTGNEVVQHKDENTLNNDISNLQLFTKSEHIKYHANKKRRDKYGKFKI